MPGLSGFQGYQSPYADYQPPQQGQAGWNPFRGIKSPEDYNNLEPDEMAASIFRQDYNRYQQIYQPVEDYMFQQLANWQPLTQEAQQAAIFQSNRQFKNVAGQQERQFRSLGIEPTAEQKESLSRHMDMQAAQSAINAANTTGRNMDSLKYGLIGGFGPYRAGAGG